MMQQFTAKACCHRVQCSDGNDYIQVTVQDAGSGCHVLELQIDFATFGKLLTGLSYLPVKAEAGNFDMIGCHQETRTVKVTYDHVCRQEDERDRKNAACAPHEVDGWRLYRGDLGNYHKRAQPSNANLWNVSAHRFVRPDGSPVL